MLVDFILDLLRFISEGDYPHTRFLPLEAAVHSCPSFNKFSSLQEAQKAVESLPMFDTIRVSGTLLFRLSPLYPVNVTDSLNRPLIPTKASRADNLVRSGKAEWRVATEKNLYIKLNKPARPALWMYVFHVPGEPGTMRVHDISCSHIRAVHHSSSVRYVEPSLSPDERWNVMLVAKTPSQMAALLELVRTMVGVPPEKVVPCLRCESRLPIPIKEVRLPLQSNYDEVYEALVNVLFGKRDWSSFADVEQKVHKRTLKRVDRNVLESWFRTLTDDEEKNFALFFEERANGRTETTPAPAPEQNKR